MKALVLAGGIPQIELIENLHRRGWEVVLADYTEHPVAEQYADRFYRVSTLDLDGIRRIAVEEKVDLIITACTDQALNTVATVSEELGLPCYISAQTGRNVTNKRYMKTVFEKNGIPTARFVILDEGEYGVPADMKYPLIVKPVDCNSSKGVARVEDDASLREALRSAWQFSRTHNAVVEEYIDGREVSVDVYVHDGVPTVLCVSESEKAKVDGKFIIYRSVVPAGIAEEAYEEIRQVAERIVRAFGLKNCPMLIQMLYRDGHVYVIEFSARTGGALKYRLIARNSGVDVIDCAVNAALGQYQTPQPRFARKFIVNEFVYTCGGVFDHLEGFEELRRRGTIESYSVFKAPGTVFDASLNSSGDRVAGFTLVADTFEELADKHRTVNGTVRVLDAEGRDMMRHDLPQPVAFRTLPRTDI